VVKPDVPDLILSVPAEHSDSVETNILVNKPSFLLVLFIDLLYVGVERVKLRAQSTEPVVTDVASSDCLSVCWSQPWALKWLNRSKCLLGCGLGWTPSIRWSLDPHRRGNFFLGGEWGALLQCSFVKIL